MADTPATQPTDDQAEAQALAQAQAGYAGKARAAAEASASAPAPAEPTAEVTPPTAGEPLAETGTSASASDPDPETTEPVPQAEPAKQSAAEAALAQQLEDLKAQVRELKASGADAETVRKMHGDIGEINRTLKQFTAVKTAEAPADDELAAALKSAEAVAEEYPDIAGPLVKAIKAMQARAATPAPVTTAAPELPDPQAAETTQAQTTEPQEEVDERGYTKAQRKAIADLDEAHPDRFEIKASPEYQAWFATWKTPEYRARVLASWNPIVVAEPFTAFKAHRDALKRKQQRLDAAATPQGTPQPSTPSHLPDEAGFERGYKRAAGHRHF